MSQTYCLVRWSAFNVSSIFSFIIISKLLIKMVDQKFFLIISTLLPVKFSKPNLPMSLEKNVP